MSENSAKEKYEQRCEGLSHIFQRFSSFFFRSVEERVRHEAQVHDRRLREIFNDLDTDRNSL